MRASRTRWIRSGSSRRRSEHVERGTRRAPTSRGWPAAQLAGIDAAAVELDSRDTAGPRPTPLGRVRRSRLPERRRPNSCRGGVRLGECARPERGRRSQRRPRRRQRRGVRQSHPFRSRGAHSTTRGDTSGPGKRLEPAAHPDQPRSNRPRGRRHHDPWRRRRTRLALGRAGRPAPLDAHADPNQAPPMVARLRHHHGPPDTRAAMTAGWRDTPHERATVARVRARWQPPPPLAPDPFEREVDPDGTLPPVERGKRAESARRAHYLRLALRSARARRTSQSRSPNDNR